MSTGLAQFPRFANLAPLSLQGSRFWQQLDGISDRPLGHRSRLIFDLDSTVPGIPQVMKHKAEFGLMFLIQTLRIIQST
jgi:hypothetical protein